MEHNLAKDFIQRIDILSALDGRVARKVEQEAMERFVRRRDPVFEPGDPENEVYIVKEGRIRLYRQSPAGKEISLALFDPGELFGEMALFFPSQRVNTAEAHEDTELFVIPVETFQRWMKEDDELQQLVLYIMADRRRAMEQKAAELVALEVPQRMAKTILWLFDRYRTDIIAGKVALNIRLTHHEIASLSGTTRETATLILNRFRRDGYIDFFGRRMILLNEAELVRIATTYE
ncbi:MAG: Crp/Fnr family transcriptional regulator [bacterium]|nr:Crp/Fnr family transcriptional regulator [bacterium]MCS7309955.1 Crp/Fnr family transcriptional regulator [Armatimonadota bacterium]